MWQEMMGRIPIAIPSAQGICIVIGMTWNVGYVDFHVGNGNENIEFFEK